MKATNAGGTTWSDAYAFRTGTVALPAIITAPVSNVATTSVTTAGNLLSYDGNDQPTVTLYYDADENASTEIPKAWQPKSLAGCERHRQYGHRLCRR